MDARNIKDAKSNFSLRKGLPDKSNYHHYCGIYQSIFTNPKLSVPFLHLWCDAGALVDKGAVHRWVEVDVS
jgi:hypothetical protein